MHLAELGRVKGLDGGGDDFDRAAGGIHGGNRFFPDVCSARDHGRWWSNMTKDTMRSQWFVIHTLSGQEQKVKESIEKRIKPEEMGEYIKEVLVPMEKVVEVRSGKKSVTT